MCSDMLSITIPSLELRRSPATTAGLEPSQQDHYHLPKHLPPLPAPGTISLTSRQSRSGVHSVQGEGRPTFRTEKSQLVQAEKSPCFAGTIAT